MVLPTVQPGSTEDDGSRWASMRVSYPAHQLQQIWFIWTFPSAISATAAFLLMFIILRRRHLRMQSMNRYLIGLVLPDFIFSGLCLFQCLINCIRGSWFGGDWTCVAQSLYVTYGFTVSIWMNVLIFHELHRMAQSPIQLKTFKPLSPSVSLHRILMVHVGGILFSASLFLPGLPSGVGPIKGLACLPLEFDLASTIFHWAFTMNFMMVIPIAFMLCYVGRIYILLFRCKDGDAHDKKTVVFFLTLFTNLIIMWVPTGVCIWVVTPYTIEYIHAFAGFWSHCQGAVTSILCILKFDIKKEFFSRPHCRRSGSPLQVSQQRSGSSVRSSNSFGALASPSLRSLRWGQSASVNSNSSQDEILAQMNELAAATMSVILSREFAPMVVIESATWFSLGHFPRSSDHVTRPVQIVDDIVIFVSHRWWGGHRPDDSDNTKYFLISDAIRALVSKFKLELAKVVVWCDWACIDQDDLDAQAKGIRSLITYAARSAFVLIPVLPEPSVMKSFQKATHPNDLVNYGERAWCRLEIYMFTCVAEITQRSLHCYGFGHIKHKAGGKGQVLRLLAAARTKDIGFDLSRLPSSGVLTVEHDRGVIGQIEEEVRSAYARFAILKRRLQLLFKAQRGILDVKEKQLRCTDMMLLTSVIMEGAAQRLRRLNLDGNLLAADGAATLMADIVCSTETPALRELSLSNNPLLGFDGVQHIGKGLAHPRCALEILVLRSCNLDASSATVLAQYIPSSDTLSQLDVSNNRIDDGAGEQLLDACGGCSEPQVALDIEGNLISVSFFRKVALATRMMHLSRSNERYSEEHSSELMIEAALDFNQDCSSPGAPSAKPIGSSSGVLMGQFHSGQLHSVSKMDELHPEPSLSHSSACFPSARLFGWRLDHESMGGAEEFVEERRQPRKAPVLDRKDFSRQDRITAELVQEVDVAEVLTFNHEAPPGSKLKDVLSCSFDQSGCFPRC